MGVREVRFCDVTGREPAEIHEIHLDQMRVEIDLCAAEYERLLEVLGPYIEAGRVEASAPSRSVARMGGSARSYALSPDERSRLRAWAASVGVEVPPNNRFKRAVIDRWRAEDGGRKD